MSQFFTAINITSIYNISWQSRELAVLCGHAEPVLAVSSRATQHGGLECFLTSSDGSVRAWTNDLDSSSRAAAGAWHSSAVTAMAALHLESCLLLISGDRFCSVLFFPFY